MNPKTPLPYSVDAEDAANIVVQGPQGETVASYCEEADAHYIAHAANCFPELVAVLTAPRSAGSMAQVEAEKLFDRAEAILAKAGELPPAVPVDLTTKAIRLAEFVESIIQDDRALSSLKYDAEDLLDEVHVKKGI